MKNKRGQVLVYSLIAIIVVALVFGGVYIVTQGSATKQSKDTLTSTGNCAVAPTLSLAYSDMLVPSTSITASSRAFVQTDKNVWTDKGYITSSSGFSLNDNVELIVNASNYVSRKIGPFVIQKCGSNSLPANSNLLIGTQAATLSVLPYQLQGTGSVLSNTKVGASANETAQTTAISPKLRISSGGSTKGTGPLVIVIDSNDTLRVGDITSTDMSKYNGQCKPTAVSQTNSGNTLRCFSYGNFADYDKGIVGSKDLTFTLSQGGGGTNPINGTWTNVSVWTGTAFVDTVADPSTGEFIKYGIEDAQTNNKALFVASSSFYVGGAP